MAKELERRKLGNTGMTPCILSLGCAWFGSDKSSDEDTIKGVHRAIELGMDFVDTSAGYGESERRVGIIMASVFGMGLLGGREPNPQPGRNRPKAYIAQAMWQWCKDREVNIQHLAMQFCMAADFEGIVMPGPYNVEKVEEAHAAATAEVPPEIWRDFRAEFGVGL